VPARSPRVSVVVPTWNAGSQFARTLQAIRAQALDDPYEMLVIDSGSTDNTLEICARHEVRTLTVPHESFGHGRTRNEAIAACSGEYVVLTVQDAIPANDRWLAALVRALDNTPRAAGAYSRHLPHDGAGFVARQVATYWHKHLGKRTEQYVADWNAFERLSLAEKQTLCTFNDVSSILRRSVWEQHPLPDLDYAEDLAWAHQVMRAGHSIVYEPDSVIHHSHERSAGYELSRAYVDGRTVGEILAEPARSLTLEDARDLLDRWQQMAHGGASDLGRSIANRLETQGESALSLRDAYRDLFGQSAVRAILSNPALADEQRREWIETVTEQYVWEPYNRRVDAVPETRESLSTARDLAAALSDRRLDDALRGVTRLVSRAPRGTTWGDARALGSVMRRRSEHLDRRLTAMARGRPGHLNARQIAFLFDFIWDAAGRDWILRAVLYDDIATNREVPRTELRARQMAHDYLGVALEEASPTTAELCAEVYLYAWSIAIGQRLGEATRSGAERALGEYLDSRLGKAI